MAFQLALLQTAVLAAIGGGLVVAAFPAGAQTTPDRLERVEITGSNIKRTDIETVAPVQVITRKEIERTGQATVAELLRSISANAGQSYNETFTNSFSPGASGIALRGLSQKNTLVLLNGRRVANYGFAQNLADTYVDLNAIPIAAVERIEVLKDGASAVYGSDAIAGVVNVILRKDYRGGEVGGSFGKANEGGLIEKQGYAIVGFGDPSADRFNVMIAANYFKRDLTRYSDRDYINDQDFHRFGGLNNNGSGAGTYQRLAPASPLRTPFATCGTNGFPGTVTPISNFSPTTLTGNACAYNPSPYLTLFPESKREQLVAAGTFQILPQLQAFADLTYSHNETSQVFTPTPFSSTSVAFNPATGGVRRIPGTLPVGNPSNPYAVPTNISYTFFDVGERDSNIVSKFYRAMGGLRGSAGKFDWEAAYLHSESEESQKDFNRVDSYVLARVLADGSYNFLNPQLTPGITNALRINPTRRSLSKLDLVDAKTSAELFSLPAGPLSFAAGGEIKRESISDRPDALITNGNVLGQGATKTDGARNVQAAYAEFSIPVIRSVEASVAAREDHYSDFGSAFSPKVGLKFKPIDELLFRATASKGFRAPSLPENSQSAATSFVTVLDPQNPNGPANVTISSVSASNPGLSPERSKNYNAGFVFAPDSTGSIGLDFYSIEQKNVVARDSAQFIVNNPGLFPNQIQRDPITGNLLTVLRSYRNFDALRTMGYDLDFRKELSIGTLGKLTLNGNWTYLQRYKVQVALGGALESYAGSNGYTALPRTRATTSLTWEYQAFTSQLTYYYTGAYAQTGSTTGQGRVGEYRQYDFYVAWEGIKNLKLYASVQNLADTHPPFDASTGGLPFDFTLYDARGRYFRAGFTYKFI
ncbi:MAG: TonB-dependent receptor [Burkholderiaceae bacterium]